MIYSYKKAAIGYRKNEKLELILHTKSGERIHYAHAGCCREHGKEELACEIEPAYKFDNDKEFQCGFCSQDKYSGTESCWNDSND